MSKQARTLLKLMQAAKRCTWPSNMREFNQRALEVARDIIAGNHCYAVKFVAVGEDTPILVYVSAWNAEEARDEAVEFALSAYPVIGAVESVTRIQTFA